MAAKSSSKAASQVPPELSRALTALRAIASWSQRDLAQAAGVSPNAMSDFERGQRTVTRDLLERMAGLMGFPPEEVDRAVHFVRSMMATLESPGSPDDGGERARIERLAVEMGRLQEETTRRLLTTLTHEGQAIEARQKAPSLWQRMKGRTPTQRRILVEEAPEFRSWALCELICKESIKAAADNADRARELAELALLIAKRMPGEAAWRSRLQGYAWAHVGNARRVGGNLPGADEAFALARPLWNSGASGDTGLLEESQVLSLEASLRTTQGRLLEAADLLDRALNCALPELRANLLLQKARVLEWTGDYESALEALAAVSPLIAHRSEPRLLFALRHNCAWNLTHLQRYSEAEALLPEIRMLVLQLSSDLDKVRVRWLEGRIAAGLNRKEDALITLSQVRAEFLKREITYDATLATLEIAVLQLEQRRTGEVKILARQMASIFQAQGVHREALAAVKLFCEAAEKEAATVELTWRVTNYLYRAQHNPLLRFEAVS